MAVIDLKNVTIRIKDGGTTPPTIKVNKPAVTVAAGCTAGTLGATTVTVLGTGANATANVTFTAHYIGEQFTLAGDSTVYTLTSNVDVNGTSLSFTPVLKKAVSTAVAFTWAASYGEEATHIAIDNGSTTYASEIKKGSIVNFGTDTTDYMITVGGASNVTSIVITPGLVSTLADNADVKIITSPHSISAELGEGDLSFSEKKTREYKLNRGRLNTVRNADEEPMEVSLNSLTWEFIKSTGNGTQDPSFEEAIKGIDAAANWTSTSSDPCEPYSCDIILENVPSCGNTGQSEMIVFPDFRWETFEYNSKDGTISVTGKCNRTEALKVRDTL